MPSKLKLEVDHNKYCTRVTVMTNYFRRMAWLRKTTGACSSDLTHRKHCCCCSQMKVYLEITSRASGHVTFELLGIPLSLVY